MLSTLALSALAFSASALSDKGPPEEFTPLTTYSNVPFTHCGTGGQCGGNQKCNNYELALSDAYIWKALGLPWPSGGVTNCPTSYFNSDADCCNWDTCPQNVRAMVPSCPVDGATTKYAVCVGSQQTGKKITAYVTGCCPSAHPCNFCKNQYGYPGGCKRTADQADLCDNLWNALGSPSQTTALNIDIGACGGPGPGPGCTDIPPDNQYTCAQQASWGKCGEPFMQGYCCKTCFNCASGCGGGGCSDTPPDNTYTCAQQASWGKCGEAFMQGYCCKSCHNCQGCNERIALRNSTMFLSQA